jgi:tripartite-type tricarboxylate transporter receptor subunit TctC
VLFIRVITASGAFLYALPSSALFVGAFLYPLSLFAQLYPSKPIRLIVPLAPGGPSDILARTIGQAITAPLGQPVVVDNRPGAGGIVGIDLVAKSPPDGYTLLLIGMSSYTITAALYAKLPFDPNKDLGSVTVLAASPFIFLVHPSVPVTSVSQLIALAKARPGDLNYASGGAGTHPQMVMELLKLKTGINIVHIPYKGTGPALTDTLAGQVQVGMFGILAALPPVQAGRLRALAVTENKRSALLPAVPTLAESGVAGFNEAASHMIMIPAATPTAIVSRLNREMVAALTTPSVKSRLANEGGEVVGNTPEQAAAAVRADLEKWIDVVRRNNLRLD